MKSKILIILCIFFALTFVLSFFQNTTSLNTQVLSSSLVNPLYRDKIRYIVLEFNDSESLEFMRLQDLSWNCNYKNKSVQFDLLPVTSVYISNLIDSFSSVVEIVRPKQDKKDLKSNYDFETKINFYTEDKLVSSLEFGNFDILQKNIYCKNLITEEIFLIPEFFYQFINKDSQEWFNGLFFPVLENKKNTIQSIILYNYINKSHKMLMNNNSDFNDYVYYLEAAQSKKIQSLDFIKNTNPEYKLEIKTGRGDSYSIYLYKKKVANQDIYVIKPESATYTLQVSHWTYQRLIID